MSLYGVALLHGLVNSGDFFAGEGLTYHSFNMQLNGRRAMDRQYAHEECIGESEATKFLRQAGVDDAVWLLCVVPARALRSEA